MLLLFIFLAPSDPIKGDQLSGIPEVAPNQLFVSTESSSFGALCLVLESPEGDLAKAQIIKRAEYPEKFIPIILPEQYESFFLSIQ